jgi:hypothetical protein
MCARCHYRRAKRSVKHVESGDLKRGTSLHSGARAATDPSEKSESSKVDHSFSFWRLRGTIGMGIIPFSIACLFNSLYNVGLVRYSSAAKELDGL